MKEPAVLTMSTALGEALRRRARATRFEACGVLLGEREGLRAVVSELRDAENLALDPRHAFVVDPRTVAAAVGEAGRRGLEVVGFFHTHPSGPARPSRRDLAESWSGASCVVATPGGEVRSVFVGRGGVALEERVEIGGRE